MSQGVLRVDHDNEDKPRGGGDPATEPINNELALVRPLGRSTWLGKLGDLPVTARLLTGPVAVSSVHASPPQLPSPDHAVAYYGRHVIDTALWCVSEYVPGVSLDRLLGVAILTPAQATFIASAIFTGLADLHSVGLSHGSLSDRKVMIGTDGAIRLSGWALTNGHPSESARSADLVAACEIVAELARNADRPVGRHSPGGRRLLVALERTGNSGPPFDAETAANALTDDLANAEGLHTGEAVLRRQIAALSDAAAKSVHIDDRSVKTADRPAARRPARAARPADPIQKAPLTEADFGGPRRHRVLWAVALVVVVLAAAGVVERHHITSFVDRLLNRNTTTNSATHNSGAPKHTQPRPVGNFGPAHAGNISNVSLRQAGHCTHAGVCPVRVGVQVKHTAAKHQVSWRIIKVNRCTGARAVAAHGRMVIPAGSKSGHATRQLHLVTAPAVGAVAVTQQPVKVASPPLLVPAQRASC